MFECLENLLTSSEENIIEILEDGTPKINFSNSAVLIVIYVQFLSNGVLTLKIKAIEAKIEIDILTLPILAKYYVFSCKDPCLKMHRF